MDLIPIKIKIGKALKDGKLQHDFPNFNRIPAPLRDNMDWSHFVDKFGGWHYDKVAGHDDDDAANDSPPGTWLGMLMLPEDFVDAAVDMFPDQVFELSDTEAESFYEGRCTCHQPEVLEDVTSLQKIAAKRQAGLLEDSDDRKALDVDDPTPGRKRNKTKTFVGLLQTKGLSVKKRQKRKKRKKPPK